MLAVSNLGGFGASKQKYPKLIPGASVFGETNDLLVPKNGATSVASNVLVGNCQNVGVTAGLLTVQNTTNISGLLTCPTNQPTVMQFIHETGTPPGFEEAGSDNVFFWLGQNEVYPGGNGGPGADEFSAIYMSHTFNMFGNGTNYEGHIKFGYFGVANNNQNGSGGGPTQLFIIFEDVSNSGGDPYTCTDLTISLNNQAKPGQIQYDQNMNLWKHVKIGYWHQMENVMLLGTAGNADGTWLCWLDGVQVANFTNVTFINATWGGQGGNGTSGFFGWQFSPWWQGGGANNKTRNDYIYFGHTYMSGLFLRAHT